MLASACIGLIFMGMYTQIVAGGYILSIEADSQKVGIYEKVEFLIHLDTKYGNPFDPDEVDLSIGLRTPTGREITIPAFYYQHYEERHMDKGNRATDWLYPVGEPVWKARFAPSEEGIYLCTATLGAFS